MKDKIEEVLPTYNHKKRNIYDYNKIQEVWDTREQKNDTENYKRKILAYTKVNT
jgi:hypothetical protein